MKVEILKNEGIKIKESDKSNIIISYSILK